MNTVLIFLPSNLQDSTSGYLVGKIERYPVDNANVYFVCGKKRACGVDNAGIIGYCSSSDDGTKPPCRGKDNWIVVRADATRPIVKEVISEANTVQLTKQKVVCVLYDMRSMMHAELFLDNTGHIPHDYFKLLAHNVRSMEPAEASHPSRTRSVLCSRPAQATLTCVLYFCSFLGTLVTYLLPVFKYSSLGLHLVAYINSFSWALGSLVEHKKMSLKTGNFLLAITVDISCGMLVLYGLMPVLTSSSLTHHLLSAANDIVTALQELPIWLMGVPAGFKLNHAFNTMLGKFFLYHINLWWTFLVVAKPLLELAFQIFLWFGRLGLTFQVSMLADLLALVSFHVYCIYVYAARLYYLQLYGLVALFRLFLGKKRNPLRDRIDSCQYSTDQLFMGTLAFTILLFLLPTTLMYYVVFTGLRVAIVGLAGLLARIRYLIEVLPIYASILWLFRSPQVGSKIFQIIQTKSKGEPLTLYVQVVPGSWWDTVVRCVPDCVTSPPAVEWFKLLQDLLVGRLIYPV